MTSTHSGPFENPFQYADATFCLTSTHIGFMICVIPYVEFLGKSYNNKIPTPFSNNAKILARIARMAYFMIKVVESD